MPVAGVSMRKGLPNHVASFVQKVEVILQDKTRASSNAVGFGRPPTTRGLAIRSGLNTVQL
jgi:hypothetical protein